jgi:hypothetical protein
MPEHDGQARVPVQGAAEYEAHGVQPGFGLVAPDGPGHPVLPVGGQHAGGARVEVDGRPAGFGGVEERGELRFVEVSPLGVGIDHDPVQAKRPHDPLYLRSGRLRVLRGDRAKAAEPAGVLARDRGECVIELAREPDGGGGLVRLDPRRVEAQDGRVLADGVHLADARVEVKEGRSHRRGVLDRAHQLHFGLVTGQNVKVVGGLKEGLGGEVLFDSDDAVAGDHGCCPFR